MKTKITALLLTIASAFALAGCGTTSEPARDGITVIRTGYAGNVAQYEIKTSDGRSLTCIGLHEINIEDFQPKEGRAYPKGSLTCDWDHARNAQGD